MYCIKYNKINQYTDLDKGNRKKRAHVYSWLPLSAYSSLWDFRGLAPILYFILSVHAGDISAVKTFLRAFVDGCVLPNRQESSQIFLG